MNRTQEPNATERVLVLLSGRGIAQALSTAASLGIAEALSEGPLPVSVLADRIGCDGEMLGRLLEVLAIHGVFEKDDEGRFFATELGSELVSDRLGGLAVFMGSPTMWNAWPALVETVRTRRSAFEATHGLGLYAWLRAHPEDARCYDEGIAPFTREQAELLAESSVFDGARTVVDLGGGRGALLIALLRRWPQLRGVLFDAPHVIAAARAAFESAGLAGRYELVGGDFFEAIPQGADVYLLKHVLHNWSDERAIEVLSTCRRSLAPGGCVMVVEGVLLPGTEQNATRVLDLEMMMLFGEGRERTKQEIRRLFSAAGLRPRGHTTALGRFARLFVARL